VELRAASPEEDEHRLIADYCQSLDGGRTGSQVVPPSPGQLMMGSVEGIRAAAKRSCAAGSSAADSWTEGASERTA
ncbi:unnamed protein product, partial [Acanthoscelides obtectus]